MLTKHILWSRLWIDPGSTPCDPGVDLGSTLKIGIVAQPATKYYMKFYNNYLYSANF